MFDDIIHTGIERNEQPRLFIPQRSVLPPRKVNRSRPFQGATIHSLYIPMHFAILMRMEIRTTRRTGLLPYCSHPPVRISYLSDVVGKTWPFEVLTGKGILNTPPSTNVWKVIGRNSRKRIPTSMKKSMDRFERWSKKRSNVFSTAGSITTDLPGYAALPVITNICRPFPVRLVISVPLASPRGWQRLSSG